jgi:hypothetical protein
MTTTSWGERMRALLGRLRGEPTPEEQRRQLKSARRALYVEREARAIEQRLDATLGQGDARVRALQEMEQLERRR